jgi:hypothetical protein
MKESIPYRETEYVGRSSRPFDERNDCAVRALMTVTGASYDNAQNYLLLHCDRREGKGTNTLRLMSRLDRGVVLGATFTRVGSIAGRRMDPSSPKGRRACPTLKMFLAARPKGRYYCLMRGHAFAVIDGVVVDEFPLGARCRVDTCWEVITQ